MLLNPFEIWLIQRFSEMATLHAFSTDKDIIRRILAIDIGTCVCVYLMATISPHCQNEQCI